MFLLMINDLDDPPTFYFSRLYSTITPDIAMCTQDVHKTMNIDVEQLGASDHNPVYLTIKTAPISNQSREVLAKTTHYTGQTTSRRIVFQMSGPKRKNNHQKQTTNSYRDRMLNYLISS